LFKGLFIQRFIVKTATNPDSNWPTRWAPDPTNPRGIACFACVDDGFQGGRTIVQVNPQTTGWIPQGLHFDRFKEDAFASVCWCICLSVIDTFSYNFERIRTRNYLFDFGGDLQISSQSKL